MIWVPEAGLFPMIPRPVSFSKRRSISSGKPSGYVGSGAIEHEAHHLPVSCEGCLCR